MPEFEARVESLRLACSRLGGMGVADDVVATAQQYYNFLRGTEDKKPAAKPRKKVARR